MKILHKIIITFFILLLATSCTMDESANQEKKATEFELVLKRSSFNFNTNTNNGSLSYKASTKDGELISTLIYKSDTNQSFTLNYDFNFTDEHWKLQQADKVIKKSTLLVSKQISTQTLKDIEDLLEVFYTKNYKNIKEKSEHILATSLNYHKSILATTRRAILENTDCGCTVHPSFLVDKAGFNCQEEQLMNVEELKTILNGYLKENDADRDLEGLMVFLNTTNDTNISFDKFYSYSISKEEYKNSLLRFTTNNNENKGDCSWWCPLGCGSDWGCCGNYSGCCYYWSWVCYTHDKICTDCNPSWFCLPGCVPD